MTIFELLKSYKYDEKFIKKNFALKKILINGDVCTSLDYKLNINSNSYWTLGEFFKINIEYFDNFISEVSQLRLNKSLQYIFNKVNRYTEIGDYLQGFICITINIDNYVFIKQESNFRP